MNIFKHFWKKDAQTAEQLSEWSEEMLTPEKGVFVKRFKRHKLAVIGLIFISIITICAIFAPLITPYSPTEITESFGEAPSMKHWLGTDQVGRDVFTRIIYAARVSLAVGVGAVVISAIIGTVLG